MRDIDKETGIKKFIAADFLATGKIDLKKWPTDVKSPFLDKHQYQTVLSQHVHQLREFQNMLFASNRNSLLVIFQGMDSSGKDGTIAHIMSGVNPQGCQVVSFKHPSAVELQHDFLWRTTCELPERGQIRIFNRSYYEDVLITRVHPEILSAESLKNDIHHVSANGIWKERYESINDLERHLHRNGTKVLKFYLHLSKAEQKRRFLSRIDHPEKIWKFNDDDMKERAHWSFYMRAYEKCLGATSTKNAPWYIVPADNKLDTRVIVSRIILEAFESLDMSYPKLSQSRIKRIKAMRAALVRKTT